MPPCWYTRVLGLRSKKLYPFLQGGTMLYLKTVLSAIGTSTLFIGTMLVVLVQIPLYIVLSAPFVLIPILIFWFLF